MRRIMQYMLALLLLAVVTDARSQRTNPAGQLRIKNVYIERADGRLKITGDMSADVASFNSQMMLRVTPVLVNGLDSLKFDEVVLVGRKRAKAFARKSAFDDRNNPAVTGEVIKMGRNMTTWSYPITLSTEFRDWLHDAKLILHEDVSGCARWEGERTDHEVGRPLLNRPAYQLAYIDPPVEEVKQRSETYSAYINFVVSKYDLLPNFRDNARVLAEVDEILTELRDDPNLTITELTITGYASPEGGYNFNIKLSENRAKSFVNYLRDKYNGQIPADMMKVSWKGEDWDGLRKQIEESDLEDKAAILEILDEPDNAARKNKLKQLNGGRTYAGLLKNLYPILRRNDYTVAYVSKAFNLEEARQVIKTKPQHLSLNEMYLVANSYPKDSPEFKETMDVVARFYPDNEIVRLNEAVAWVENGAYDRAIPQLLQIEQPEAWNALGIAYYYTGDFERSQQFFRKAADAGLDAAAKNAEAYRNSMTNRF
ncbi:DUF3868 domain-containing protein [Alistipes sp. OttesenSCG-928-B03]|nr:DUF3868 domain-containing protein [Alistipes sp. OttesenSCG-928-B03]